ncbi:hypothetical protein C8Q70DRAFT_1050007 [Cubamyces menziesii]|nr:hypothetical protein C8Q70DRAFT_1050007 [Cubamyces menziesii]
MSTGSGSWFTPFIVIVMPDEGRLEGHTPISAPQLLPSVIFCKPGARSLQSQMRLNDDYITFAKLMWLIRHVAARHVNLTVSYSLQRPAQLAKIVEEVLRQSTILRDDYVDAWPITYYLRIALKKHKPSHSYQRTIRGTGRKKLAHDERCYIFNNAKTWSGMRSRRSPRTSTSEDARIDYTSQLGGSAAAEVPTSIETSPSSGGTVWSDQLSTYMERYKKIIASNHGSTEEDSDTSVERESSEIAVAIIERDLTAGPETNGVIYPDPSFRATPEAYVPHGDQHDPSFQRYRTENFGQTHDHRGVPLSQYPESLQSMAHTSSMKVAAGMSINSGETIGPLEPVTIPSYRHGLAPIPDRSISSYSILPTPSPSEAETEIEAVIVDTPDDILGMLLEYELPHTDAERIVELLGTLGIGDIQYLRVLGNMASCDVWLQELKAEGKLSEIELRVLREILDQLGRDFADDESTWDQVV